ncbi:MAG: glycosyltransferase family 2 protein [Bdellovibrionales bacterium]|nr:glycosyltransferase family 2 protein [Bdellovibrionales bacterium]
MSLMIGVCTSGRIELLFECLYSLQKQDFDMSQVQIVVPLMAKHQPTLAKRLSHFDGLNIETPFTDEYNASTLRNLFLKTCKQPLLYMIDEDCSLPKSTHLRDLVAYHQAFPKVEVIGGRYQNGSNTSYFGKAYNLVCDLWQDRNDFYSQSDRLKHVLGGNMSLKISREIKMFRFGDQSDFGGEELSYLKQLQKAGIRVMLVNGLNITHNAQHDIASFLSRAWLHGGNKYYLEKENFGTVFKDRTMLFSKQRPADEKILAGAYLGIVQLSYLKEFVKNDLSSRSLGHWKRQLLKRT